MITLAHEQTREGPGEGFFDSVTIDFCHPEGEIFGLVRLVRLPNAGLVRTLSALFVAGAAMLERQSEAEGRIDSWELALHDQIEVATVAPLERWRLSLAAPDVAVELDARALSPPIELGSEQSGIGGVAGIEQYEQLCELSGLIKASGRSHAARCTGRRAHAWGSRDWGRVQRWRSLYASAEGGRGVTVTGARPAASEGHDEELRVGRLVGGDGGEPGPLEQVRISTVFGSDRLPAKAGLELLSPGEEIPRRFGAVAVCGTRLQLGREATALSFLRWSFDSEAAYGVYETLSRT